MSIPKFWDTLRPPPGNWHYYYDVNRKDTMFVKASPSAVIDAIEVHRKNNNRFVSREAIEAEVWAHWCSYQPERCGLIPTAGAQVGPVLPADLTKEFVGAIIWRFLNLAAVRFDFIGRAGFLATVEMVNPLMPCPICRTHWEEILAANSPADITTTKEACEWANKVHNLVNASLGKAQYAYSQGVKEYGFPL